MFYAMLGIRIRIDYGWLDPDPGWTHKKILDSDLHDLKCWIRIRIRIETYAEQQHWFSIKKMLAESALIKMR
jgi:hypothetical protein